MPDGSARVAIRPESQFPMEWVQSNFLELELIAVDVKVGGRFGKDLLGRQRRECFPFVQANSGHAIFQFWGRFQQIIEFFRDLAREFGVFIIKLQLFHLHVNFLFGI